MGQPTAIHIHPAGALLALVGNPNCGKTALFNSLTGSRQKVANYAGVTVERKEGRLTSAAGRALRLLDLPGTYSLQPRSAPTSVSPPMCSTAAPVARSGPTWWSAWWTPPTCGATCAWCWRCAAWACPAWWR
jgi:hypothetical protein